MLAPNNVIRFLRQQPVWRWVVAAVVIAGAVWFFRGGHHVADDTVAFTARRGPLDITVLEGGSAQALESQEVKCEVRVGYQGVKVLKIVDEGYQVTEDDVRTNKVLVELDSSDIQKQITQQEIQYQSAAASLTEAQQAYEIQINQNLSDIKAAEQKARFARMDFDKFLGDQAAQDILTRLDLGDILEKLLAALPTNTVAPPEVDLPKPGAVPPPATTPPPSTDVPKVIVAGSTSAPPASAVISVAPEALPGGMAPPAIAGVVLTVPPKAPGPEPAVTIEANDAGLPPALTQTINIDFSEYAKVELLGDGEAKQKIRKFEDDLQVAKKEYEQARLTRDGTKRLYDKEFVTRNDLERDEIALENSRLKVQTAETAQELFLKYEFPKSAEEALSKFLEATRELDRARKAAISKLAQAEARLKSAQGQYSVQSRQRKELQEQLGKCLIHAEKPGLVVYGGGEEMYWRGEEQIREGATVRERQSIITIPDMTKMSVKVKIHESYIKKVKKGQKAQVTVDAFPDQVLTGEVTYVGVLPDSQNRWMNPDMKVYRTTVTIDGTHDWLKPGMSAKVEILVDKLGDVVYVPIQAVSPSEGKQVCYVMNGGPPERREVEVGQFNDSFIEVKSGLKEGERVYLRPPETPGPQPEGEPETPGLEPKPTTPAPAMQVSRAQ